MPGKPKDLQENKTENTEQPTLTDRLNKYLLCAYLNRLNEEDRQDGEWDFRKEDPITEDTFSD